MRAKTSPGVIVALAVLAVVVVGILLYLALKPDKVPEVYYGSSEVTRVLSDTNIVFYDDEGASMNTYDLVLTDDQGQEQTFHVEGDAFSFQGAGLSDGAFSVAAVDVGAGKRFSPVSFEIVSDEEASSDASVHRESLAVKVAPDDDGSAVSLQNESDDAEDADESEDSNGIPYVAAYKPVLMTYFESCEDAENPMYAVYDLDDDGVLELLVSTSESGVSSTVHVYAMVEDDSAIGYEAKEIGSFDSSQSMLLERPEGGLYKGIFAPNGSDTYSADAVVKEGDKLVVENEFSLNGDEFEDSPEAQEVFAGDSIPETCLLVSGQVGFFDLSPIRELQDDPESTVERSDDGIVIDNDYFKVTLPAAWSDDVTVEEEWTDDVWDTFYTINVMRDDVALITFQVGDFSTHAPGDLGSRVYWEDACDREECVVRARGDNFPYILGMSNASSVEPYRSLGDEDKDRIIQLSTGGTWTLSEVKDACENLGSLQDAGVPAVFSVQSEYYEDVIHSAVELKRVEKEDPEASSDDASDADASGGSGGSSAAFEGFPQSFRFTSGAGAWGTDLEVAADGSFTGRYSDTDAGATGSGYPNGTRYETEFSGKFTAPERVGDYAYRMQLERLEITSEPGESIEDGVLVVRECGSVAGLGEETSSPAGEYTLYVPGQPLDELSDLALSWLFVDGSSGSMDFYAIVNSSNPDGDLAFRTD